MMSEPIQKRYEFVFLYDVTHGNPNGDPDAGNQPRVDPETGFGIVTDVCLKRKIRNFVATTKGYAPPHDIYVKDRGILAKEQRKAYEGQPASESPNMDARGYMCRNYYDVRTFGAVMTTGKAEEEADDKGAKSKGGKKNAKLWNCGQVRGPVQIGFSRSQSPIFSMEHTITRTALTNADDTDRGSASDDKAASGQMGRKHTVPYGLYRVHGFISPALARDTGFSEDDLELFFSAIAHMFDDDRSAARGEMYARELTIFEHKDALGNAPAHKLFDLIKIDRPAAPRQYADYKIEWPAAEQLPSGVTLRRYI